MIDFSELSLETFQVLRAYGKEIVLFDENGNRVFEPADARRFYLSSDNILVSILDDGDNSAIKTYLSTNIQIAEVLEFITVLRRIATQFNVLFNVRKYNKKITPRDFATQAAVQEQKEYSMNIMEGLYGTSKSSYLKLENARMIVRHSARVKENMIGGRGRAIQSIFVENAMGERFLFPVNVLSGARAMTQHVNHGGTFADAVGQQIIRMAQDFSNLSTVANHVGTNAKVLPAQAASLREAIRAKGMEIRRTFERMCRDETSYIRESARITEAEALTESPDNLAETVEAIRSLIAVEGVSFDDAVLETVAKRVGFSEDMRPDTNAPDNTQDPDDGKPAQPVQPTKPVAPGQQNNDQDGNNQNGNGSDNDEEQENGSFHEDEEMDDESVDEEVEPELADVAETAAVRAFDAWMEDFDPDFFFSEGKSYKRNDDDEDSAEEKKKQDKQRREERDNKKRTDESVIAESIIDMIDDDFEPDPDWVYDNEDEIISDVHACISMARENPAMFKQLAYKVQKGIRALDLAGFSPMDVVDLEDPTVQAMGISESLEEGKSFKRNKDEDADDKKKQDKQRRDNKKQEPVEEGKSFKRNKDEDADDKKKQDKDRRDSSKNKKTPVVESHNEKFAVFGLLSENGRRFSRSFVTAEDRDTWLSVNEGVVVHGFADPMAEGKSYKRNDDDDAKSKKEKDDERRQAREDKKKPVEEGKSFKRNDDEDGDDVKQKRKEDKKRRDDKKDEQPVEEGKSFKRNDDDEESADDKKKQDKQRREERDNKKRTDEGWVHYSDKRQMVAALKAKYGDQLSAHKMPSNTFQYLINGIKTVGMWDGMIKQGKMLESVQRTDEASDLSFDDAKQQYKTVKQQLSKMSPFDKNYVSTKAHLGKLEDRLKRADQDDLDEASDISFNDAKAELPHVKQKLGKMNPFDKEYIATKARHDKLKDRLSRMQDDEVDESVGDDALYGGMPADEFHNWVDYGNPVRFKAGTGYERPGVWTPSQLNVNANRCWVGDEDNRGWYVSLDHLIPHHEGDEEETDESYVSGDGGFGGDSSDVIEGAEKKNPALNESGVFDMQKYLKSIR